MNSEAKGVSRFEALAPEEIASSPKDEWLLVYCPWLVRRHQGRKWRIHRGWFVGRTKRPYGTLPYQWQIAFSRTYCPYVAGVPLFWMPLDGAPLK